MLTSRMLRRPLVVGCALALTLFATHDATSFAQRRAGNPCLDIVNAAELPIQGLDTVRPPRGLHTACRQFVRMPAPTRERDSIGREIARDARADAYRAILRQIIAVTECEGLCALLRETITAYVSERFARDVYAEYEADLEGYDTPEFRRYRTRSQLERVTDVVRSYDQSIALAHTEPLPELEAALRRRRDAVDRPRTRLRVDAYPMIPGTQCAAELEAVSAPEAPAQRRRQQSRAITR